MNNIFRGILFVSISRSVFKGSKNKSSIMLIIYLRCKYFMNNLIQFIYILRVFGKKAVMCFVISLCGSALEFVDKPQRLYSIQVKKKYSE
jgi:hypothetical protein